ncbi:MAG: hypothetical protein Q8873_07260 [Bacillota bacterium]|nr:hypothetical protein [Bacillota bacterium]
MSVKLLKYEFRAMGRTLLPIYAAVIILGFVAALFTRINPFNDFSNFNVVKVLFIVALILYGGFVISAMVLSITMSVTRFRKGLLEAEGYLMNTLPVSQSQNILSKLITACVYQILGTLAAFISGLFVVFIGAGSHIKFSDLIHQISLALKMYGGNIALYGVEMIILGIISLVCLNLMFYASMSIGHSFNSKKIFKSVCAFIGLYILTQIINTTYINIVFMIKAGDNMTNNIYIPQPYIWAVIILEAFYAVAYFITTHYFMKNRLNLQ